MKEQARQALAGTLLLGMMFLVGGGFLAIGVACTGEEDAGGLLPLGIVLALAGAGLGRWAWEVDGERPIRENPGRAVVKEARKMLAEMDERAAAENVRVPFSLGPFGAPRLMMRPGPGRWLLVDMDRAASPLASVPYAEADAWSEGERAEHLEALARLCG